ncbi:hypothetical protein M8J76_001813 [Diaphorina citri]|nr:hypothetical protein M8J76_001813 [Diaphorina citri]
MAELTCYTCVNVSDNLICNQYAIDHPCPQGQDFCHTLHIMDSTGASVVVNKKCANSTECWPLGVGCLHIDAQTVCVSCCDDMYCNVTVPTNKSNAVFSNKRAKRRKTQIVSSCCPAKAQNFSLFLLSLVSVTMGSLL